MDAPHLTPREKQIALRLLKFDTRKEIAARFHLAVRTVDFHLYNLKRKLRAQCLAELTLTVHKLNGALRSRL